MRLLMICLARATSICTMAILSACGGGGGSGGGSTPESSVSLTLNLSQSAIYTNENTVLAWSSSGATNCVASGSWSGAQTTAGSLSLTSLSSGSYTYTLACTGSGGSATKSATVTVTDAPIVSPWSTPVQVSESAAGAAYTGHAPNLGADSTGNFIAVWLTYNAALGTLQVDTNRFNHSTGTWGAPQTLSSAAVYNEPPALAVDGNGNAIAAWSQKHGTTYGIYARRFTASSGTWGAAVEIDVPVTNRDARTPVISVDGAGYIIAAWWQYNTGSDQIINVARFNPNTGSWSAPVALTSGTNIIWAPSITSNASGNAVVAWLHSTGAGYLVMMSRYSASTNAWSSQEQISTVSASTQLGIYPAAISLDSSSNITIAWSQQNGSRYVVYSKHCAAGAACGTQTQVDVGATTGDSSNVAVIVDISGIVSSVWQQSNGLSYGIWSSRYNPATLTWSIPSAVINADTSTRSSVNPKISINEFGGVIAVWRQYDSVSGYTISSSTESNGIWSSPINVDAAPTSFNDSYFPGVSSSAIGVSMVAWPQFVSSMKVLASHL